MPLLVVAGKQAALTAPRDVLAALDTWGHDDTQAVETELGQLELVLDARANRMVFDPLLTWLQERRRGAWVAR